MSLTDFRAIGGIPWCLKKYLFVALVIDKAHDACAAHGRQLSHRQRVVDEVVLSSTCAVGGTVVLRSASGIAADATG